MHYQSISITTSWTVFQLAKLNPWGLVFIFRPQEGSKEGEDY